jgi:Tol biopolymer transport system component
VRSWFRAADGREWLVYTTSDAASWKIWRARISLQGATDENPELVTSGSGLLQSVSSVSEDGKLSYNIVSVNMSLNQISMGGRGEKTGPTIQLPLPEGGNYTSPSVSWDGKKMVYVIANPNQPNLVMLRDLTTGKDHLVDDKGRRPGAIDYTAEIAPDGSTVIFERDCKQGLFPEDHMSPLPCSFTVSAAGGEPEQICERCTPHGFSSDGSVLLFNKFDLTDGNKDRIVSMNLRTRSEQDFLSDSKQSLYNANLSWDKRWVVFVRALESA